MVTSTFHVSLSVIGWLVTPSRQDKAVALKKLRKKCGYTISNSGGNDGLFHPLFTIYKNATQTLKNEMERSLYDLKKVLGMHFIFSHF